MFLIPCIIICLLLFGYIGLIYILNKKKNPYYITNSEKITNKLSSVTHKYIGKRGDMGNQIFQLACIIAAGKRSNANIILPENIKSLPVNDLIDLTDFEFKNLDIDGIFYEYDNYEYIEIPTDGKNYEIRGYRQSYKYFQDYEKEIREILKPKDEILNKIKEVINFEYIAVHIRKGDYVKLMHKIPLLREFRKCSINYYKEGIKKIRETYPEIKIIVCTDSPKWIKNILNQLDDNIMISPIIENINPKLSDFSILYLAKAVIMSNSTYSWMSSYLNPNRLIIAPTPWWDPDGFIGKGFRLDNNLLHYPDWILLHTDTGNIIRNNNSHEGDRYDNSNETLNIYRAIRGIIV